MSLEEIQSAGQKLAEIQFPLFLKKQLTVGTIKKEKKKNNKTDKTLISKEKLLKREREKRKEEHEASIHETAIEAKKEMIMRELYFGLVDLEIPEEYQHLVATGNPQMDSINRYNVLEAMRTALMVEHPRVFSLFA
jgi:hypothetical protein